MQIIENQENIRLEDPLKFPWEQKSRPFYAFIFIVNLGELESFEDVKFSKKIFLFFKIKSWLDKIGQVERDKRKNSFTSKKVIVGTKGGKNPKNIFFYSKIPLRPTTLKMSKNGFRSKTSSKTQPLTVLKYPVTTPRNLHQRYFGLLQKS